MTTVLIDGDILVYQVAAASERPAYDWGDGIYSPATADLTEAIALLRNRILTIKNGCAADRVAIALKDKDNFRKRVYPGYKANRNPAAVPMLRTPLMEWLRTEKAKSVWSRPGLEGDDVIGILATSDVIIPGEKYIWSIDKDVKQIPGKHLNEDFQITEVFPEDGEFLFYQQTLTGDSTDNYPGCPGIGPKRAVRILEEAWSHATEEQIERGPSVAYWPTVVDAYQRAGLSADVALTQARVARILRNTDYDFKERKPILWTPPGA